MERVCIGGPLDGLELEPYDNLVEGMEIDFKLGKEKFHLDEETKGHVYIVADYPFFGHARYRVLGTVLAFVRTFK